MHKPPPMEPSTNRYPLSSICTIIPRSSGLCKIIFIKLSNIFLSIL